mgnify:CR=1 FL=1
MQHLKHKPAWGLGISDDDYIKLRVDSIAEGRLPFAQRRGASRNRIMFTHTSQLGESHNDFLKAKP